MIRAGALLLVLVALLLFSVLKGDKPVDPPSSTAGITAAQATTVDSKFHSRSPDRNIPLPAASSPDEAFAGSDLNEPGRDSSAIREQCDLEIMAAHSMQLRFDVERLRSVSWFNTQYLDHYRGLSMDDLKSLGGQGDGQALFALGFAEFVEELGLDGNLAIPLFKGEVEAEGLEDWDWEERIDLEGFTRLSETLYEAAQQGNLGALEFLADLHRYSGISPVDLGWLEADEWPDSMTTVETGRRVRAVYVAVIRTLIPESLPSTYIEPYDVWEARAQRELGILWDRAVIPMSQRFREDLAERQLSLPEVQPRRSYETYFSESPTVCTSELIEQNKMVRLLF